jgi:hypothetical protein
LNIISWYPSRQCDLACAMRTGLAGMHYVQGSRVFASKSNTVLRLGHV